ncbi:MAG: TIGR02281 family clan AA aspartic protease [Rhizobiaceae bacterium]
MLRNLIIVGAVVGISASIPIFYESNPDSVDKLIDDLRPREKVTEIVVPVKRAKPEGPRPGEVAPLAGRRVQMTMDRDGHFSGSFKLNGRRVESLVDTGATLVAINRSTARRIGLNLLPADFKYEVNTANGTTKAAAAKIKSLQIGRIYVTDVEVVVLDDRALDNALIGMSFLKRLSRFNVENRTLILEQ